jgi:hypothetical protein
MRGTRIRNLTVSLFFDILGFEDTYNTNIVDNQDSNKKINIYLCIHLFYNLKIYSRVKPMVSTSIHAGSGTSLTAHGITP